MTSLPTHWHNSFVTKIEPFSFPRPPEIDLSLIVVSYNTRERLMACLRSVFAFTQDLEFEIFVVDNNSPDNSADAVAEHFPQVHLIRNLDNRGYSCAANQALRQSRGRYCILLNSDALLEENSFHKIVAHLDARPEYYILTPKILDAEGKLCAMRLWRDSPMDALRKILGFYDASSEGPRMGTIENKETEVAGGPCLAFRRSLFETIGLMDESFFLYNEEDDLSRRAHEKGLKVCFFAETAVTHFLSQSCSQPGIRAKVMREAYKSDLNFYRKYYSFSWNLLLRLAYRLAFFLGAARSAFRRISGIPSTGSDDSAQLKMRLFFLKIP